MNRALGVVVACAAACGQAGDPAPTPAVVDHLEQAIARELAVRFAAPLVASCDAARTTCTSALPDGTALTVHVARDGAGWSWKLDGDFVDTAPIATYVAGVLADLGVAQTASCGPRVVRVPHGDRLACGLSGGGTAFVAIGSDGALALELALDHDAATARGEATTPEHEQDLEARSRALAQAADADDNP